MAKSSISRNIPPLQELNRIKSDSMANHYADTMGYVTGNMSLGNSPIPLISNNHRLKGSENE